MAVLVFQKEPTTYHYPPSERQPEEEVTRCGLKAAKTRKNNGAGLLAHEGAVPSNWQPCDACSELDDRDRRFAGPAF
jgi:hypothetical protein